MPGLRAFATNRELALRLIIVFVFLLLCASRLFPSGRGEANVFATNLPISAATKEAVGYNYYAELARSFLNFQTSLIGPYHPQLASHPNPYGADAYEKGIIIQDASLYNGRYYLYFGPLPALLVYAPFKLVFGQYPSDNLVMFLLCLAAVLTWLFALEAVRACGPLERTGLMMAALCNPFVIMVFTIPSVHWVARTSASLLLVFGAAVLYAATANAGPPDARRLTIGAIAISLSGLCKINFFLPAAIVLGLAGALAWADSRITPAGRVRVALALAGPIACAAAIALLYNYVRFDSIFEPGISLQTNSLDHRSEGAVALRLDPLYALGVLLERGQMYFLSFPYVSPQSGTATFAPLEGFASPLNPRFYVYGMIGVLHFIPLVALAYAYGAAFLGTAPRALWNTLARQAPMDREIAWAVALALVVAAQTIVIFFVILAFAPFAIEFVYPALLLYLVAARIPRFSWLGRVRPAFNALTIAVCAIASYDLALGHLNL